jgi:putative peptide zinc metalloprotease protein
MNHDMNGCVQSCPPSPAARIAVRRRTDLVVSRQRQRGQTAYVVKDPLSLRYYRLEEHEYAVLQMLDGRATLRQVADRLAADFPQLMPHEDDVSGLVDSLYQNALVIGERPGQGTLLRQRRDRQRRQRRRSLLGNVLAIRCPGVDPTRLLNVLHPWTARFFGRPAVMGVAVLAIIALAVAAAQAARFPQEIAAMHRYFGPCNWLLLAATLAATKILHELGHALACRRFGGECHEIGVMLLVLTPCLYCDVSDSWLLGNKWHRAAIAAAGMYVEVALASVATLIWANTGPGDLHFLALQVMLICGVSTVLFNGNPLARYDGYYILADLVDIPNLRQEARVALASLLWRGLLGVERSAAPGRVSWKLALFGCGVSAYRWILLACILWFLYHVLSGQGLEVVWQYMALLTVSAAVVVPGWRLANELMDKELRRQMQRRRVIMTTSVLVGIVGFVALVPLPCHVYGPFELRVEQAVPVYAPRAATLARLMVEPGQAVAAGQLLANLRGIDLELAVARLASTASAQQTWLASLRYERHLDPKAAAAAPYAEELLEATRSQLDERRRDLAQFQLTAPRSGVVLAPPRRQAMRDEPALSSWSGTPLDARNEGVFLAQGDVLCEIGDPRRLEAVLVVDQADVGLLRRGQSVQAVLDARPWRRLRGEIREIARQHLDITPESLSIQAGGGIASRIDDRGIERPISASYTVRIPLDGPAELLVPGMRGTAKIRTGSKTIASRAWRAVCRTFQMN